MIARRLSAWVLLAALAACLLAAAPAEARDRARRPGAVDQLQPKEIEVLRRKIPNWDQLDPRRREHIARGVIRLRTLTPEQRKKLERRLKELGKRPRPKRDPRPLLMAVGHGVGEMAWKELPQTTRRVAAEAKVRARFVQMAIFQKLLGRIAWQESKAAVKAPPKAFPERYRRRAATIQAQLRSGTPDEKTTRRLRAELGKYMVHGKVELLLRRLAEEEGIDRRKAAKRMGETVRATWPKAYAQTLKYVQENPGKIIEWAERQRRRSAHGGPDRALRGGSLARNEWILLVWQLERAAITSWRRQPEVRKRADAIVRTILVRELGVKAEDLDRLPPRSKWKERAGALRALLGRLARAEGRRPGGPGGPPGGNRRRVPDRPGRGEKDAPK